MTSTNLYTVLHTHTLLSSCC